MTDRVLVERRLLETAIRLLDSAVGKSVEAPSVIESLANEIAQAPPSLYVVIRGGIVQSVESDRPDAVASALWRVAVVDYDTFGTESEARVPLQSEDGSFEDVILYEPCILRQSLTVP